MMEKSRIFIELAMFARTALSAARANAGARHFASAGSGALRTSPRRFASAARQGTRPLYFREVPNFMKLFKFVTKMLV